MANSERYAFEEFTYTYPDLARKISDRQSVFCAQDSIVVVQSKAYVPLKLHEILEDFSANTKVLVVIRENVSVTIRDLWQGSQRDLMYYVERNANVSVTSVCTANLFSLKQVVLCEECSTFTGTLVTTGSGTIALSLDLLEQGSCATMYGAQILGQDERMTIKAVQVHHAADTSSCVEFKGVLGKGCAFDHRGTIDIGAAAHQAHAVQRTTAIACGDGIHFVSKPCFQSKVHDVHCVHASALAKLDEQQRWYMASRGLHDDQIYDMLVEAFLSDAFKSLDVASKKMVLDKLKKMIVA